MSITYLVPEMPARFRFFLQKPITSLADLVNLLRFQVSVADLEAFAWEFRWCRLADGSQDLNLPITYDVIHSFHFYQP